MHVSDSFGLWNILDSSFEAGLLRKGGSANKLNKFSI